MRLHAGYARMSFASLAVIFLLSFTHSAAAHKLAPSLLEISEIAPDIFNVVWRTPRNAAVTPEPSLPANCQSETPDIEPVGTALEWRWRMDCNGGLAGKTLSVKALEASRTAALLRLNTSDTGLHQQLLTAENASYTVPAKADGNALLKQYFLLGGKHILIGIDHLLFVTGLLLLASRWQTLLKTVTAFTLGHSCTLALVSLNIIPQWPALIELGIAATILILALELSRPEGRSLLSRYQWPMAAAFGLVHGLGFAGVLKELGLPQNDILPALLAFNVGIEAGQLLFVAGVALLLYLFHRSSAAAHNAARWATIYAMGGISVYWCLERGITLIADLT
jgi:hypothetical protein